MVVSFISDFKLISHNTTLPILFVPKCITCLSYKIPLLINGSDAANVLVGISRPYFFIMTLLLYAIKTFKQLNCWYHNGLVLISIYFSDFINRVCACINVFLFVPYFKNKILTFFNNSLPPLTSSIKW